MQSVVESSIDRVERVRRDQRGLSLIEVLVALVILSLGVSGMAFAMFGGMTAGASARKQSELNTLLTSYGESVKGLPYFVCAQPQDYETAFDNAEDLTPDDLKLQGRLNATLGVVTVADNDPGSTTCPSIDSGTQLVTLSATSGDIEQTITVVKRTPDPSAPPAIVDFDPLLRTGLNSTIVEYGLEPKVISTPGVALYEWWCYQPPVGSAPSVDAWMEDVAVPTFVSNAPVGSAVAVGGSPTRDPDYVSTDPYDPGPKCAPGNPGDPGYRAIEAPVRPATASTWIGLRVTEQSGVTYPVYVHHIDLPDTTISMSRPQAVITQTSSPSCLPAAPCSTQADVIFVGSSSSPGDGRRFVMCSWEFSDGTEPQVFMGTDCAEIANVVAHRFTIQGTYSVTLTVTNDVGQRSSASKQIVSEGPARPRPTVVVSTSLNAGASWQSDDQVYGIQPLDVRFRSNGTVANGGAVITGYSWTFGDGSAPTSGATAAHNFQNPSGATSCLGTPDHFPVTLRVDVEHPTDNWTSFNTATVCVRVAALVPPTTLASGGASAYSYWEWRWPFWFMGVEFTYRWIPPALSPTDQGWIVKVRNRSTMGFVCSVDTSERVLDIGVGPMPNSSFWQGSYRDPGLWAILETGWNSTWGLIRERCQFELQLIRVDYLGNHHPTAWSAPQPYSGFW